METVETISNLLVDGRVVPPNTQVLKFNLGFDHIHKGVNDSTSSIYLTHGEFVFNDEQYLLLNIT